jgi:hypothetical protein
LTNTIITTGTLVGWLGMTVGRKQLAARSRCALTAEFNVEAVQRAEERRTCARRGARLVDVCPRQGRLRSDAVEAGRVERENRRFTRENVFLRAAAANIATESQ